ncbi:MFS transporter [Sodalis sp. RH22]|uniref:MFS transporter n=1 Tax=unclassified Sodalis (in: enterobacteria) TaxID=2636512 RepID=UPI0039B466B8
MKENRFFGWYVVYATHILLALIFGAAYSFGAFFSHIQSSFSAGSFSVASIFSLTALLYYIVGVFSGTLADRLSPRAVVITGIALLSMGFFASSFLSFSLHWFILCFGLLVGLGVGLVYVPAITTTQRWFITRRSQASGIALAGTGVGTFIGPTAAGWLMQSLSWEATLRIFAVFILISGVLAGCLMRSKPEAYGLLPDGEKKNENSPPGSGKASAGSGFREAVTAAPFWWYFSAIFLGSVGLFLALVHINPYARQFSLSASEANLLIGLIGVGNVAGRLFLGRAGDRMGPRRLLQYLTFSLALLNLFWLEAHSFWSLAIFALLFGVANGGCIALYPAVAAGWYGTTNLGAILGALYISVGVAAVAGGSLGGLLFDLSHTYSASILFSTFCALLSVLCIIMARRAVNKGTNISAID